MPQTSQNDALEFEVMEFPYDKITGELQGKPRFVDGLNLHVTSGGKLMKRPGTTLHVNTVINKKCYGLISYETLDTPPVIYLLGTFLNAGTGLYEVYYNRTDGPAPGWTKITDVRDVNLSQFPHEFCVFRGKVYIKAFPAAGGNKYASVIFDGTGGTVLVDFWGLEAPDDAAGVVNPGSWTLMVNTHAYTVMYGWKYTYAWESRTKNISARAPLQTNPDKLPSDTGTLGTVAAGAGHCPEIQVTGHADTTRVPYINIYRTMDGGGTFYFIKQIPNTGAVTHTFVDKYEESGVSGGTFSDPALDAYLDTSRPAPSETSNFPPPAVSPPKSTGVDAVMRSSPIESYAGRLWYFIGNYLFFSGEEEIIEGVPAECFPGGVLAPNYYKLDAIGTNLIAAPDALYVTTLHSTWVIAGTDKESFTCRPFIKNIGHPFGHPRAKVSMGDTVAWLGHDYRIITVTGGRVRIVSDPLNKDLVNAVNGLGQMELSHWTELDNAWLIVSSHRPDDTTNSRQWVLDWNRTAGSNEEFWFTPWDIRATSVVTGRLNSTDGTWHLSYAVWDGANTCVVWQDVEGNERKDYTNAAGSQGFTWFFTTNLMTIPAGNHVNSIVKPVKVPVIQYVQYERTIFDDDVEPQVYGFFDDTWTDPADLRPADDPARRVQSKGYKTAVVPVQQVGYRFSLKMQRVLAAESFELHTLAVVYNPGGGV